MGPTVLVPARASRTRVRFGDLALALFAFVAIAGAHAVVRAQSLPSTVRYELSNGLHVVLDPLPGRDTVTVLVSVDVGRRDQPDGWTGLAHLTEHLLFRGTAAAPGDVSSRLDAWGAIEHNGETSDDFTRYYEVVPRGALERVLWLEAERLAHGMDAVDDAAVEQQRRVVDRERELRTWGREAVWDLVLGLLYPAGHPYSRALERRDDVQAIRATHVHSFFQRHYVPARITLVVSGGFDPDPTRAWIERYFAPLRPAGAATPPPIEVPPPVRFDGERRVLAEAQRADDLLYVIWPSPPWGTASDAALDFVASELEHRLEERIRVAGGALSVDVRQDSGALCSTFEVVVTVPRGQGTLASLEALDAELATMRETPMDARVLDRWRTSFVEGEIMRLDDSLQRAQRLGQRMPAFPGGYFDVGANLERYRAVTADATRDAAREWLPAGRRLVVSIASRREAPIEGRIISELTLVDGEVRP
ncbi:Zinc protease [Sandaracinus amylolyticus]|uniref:Zinc protease n=2 Tax=Sandaracinus amylolyticus TaxID=927083 RepID=A0A0F6W9L1_9BACT|nr:Zinc protease [Sandaracinus amylolyticus]